MSSLRRIGAEWLWLVAALLVFGVLQVLAAGRSSPYGPLDSRSDASNGTLALASWLQRLGYPVQRIDTPSGLGTLAGASGTLFILRPDVDVTGKSCRAITEWIHGGGNVVLATDGTTGTCLTRAAKLIVTFGFGGHVTVPEPVLVAPPVRQVSGVAEASVNVATSYAALTSPVGPALVAKRLGAGNLWVLTAPDLLDNASIAKVDNRKVALNLAGAPGTRVYFDEAVPSPPAGNGGTPGWATGTPWGIAFLFSVLAVVLYRWLAGRRTGPPVPVLDETYRPASEYVLSVAGLLRRSGARETVLRLYREDLSRRLRRAGFEAEDTREPDNHVSQARMMDEVNEIVRRESELRRDRV